MFSFSMSFKIELTWLIPSDCNVLIKHLSWLCSPKSHTFWAMSRSPNVAWMKTVITKNALILSKKKYCFSSVSSFLFSVKTQVSFLWFFVSNKKFLFHLLLFQLHTLFSRVFFLFSCCCCEKISLTSVLFNRWATTELYSVLLPVSSNEFSCCCCWSNWANTVWPSAQQSARLSFGVDLQLIFTLEFSAQSQLRRCCSSYVPRGRFLLPVHSNNNRKFDFLVVRWWQPHSTLPTLSQWTGMENLVWLMFGVSWVIYGWWHQNRQKDGFLLLSCGRLVVRKWKQTNVDNRPEPISSSNPP